MFATGLKRRLPEVLAVLCLVGALPASAVGRASPAAMCSGDESLLFGFPVQKSGKVVALCVSSTKDYLVYRFGIPGKVELEFPEDKSASWGAFTYYSFGETCDRRGMGGYLSFSNGDFTYTVRDRCFFADEGEGIQVDIEVKNTRTGKVSVLMGNADGRQGGLEKVDRRIPRRQL